MILLINGDLMVIYIIGYPMNMELSIGYWDTPLNSLDSL